MFCKITDKIAFKCTQATSFFAIIVLDFQRGFVLKGTKVVTWKMAFNNLKFIEMGFAFGFTKSTASFAMNGKESATIADFQQRLTYATF